MQWSYPELRQKLIEAELWPQGRMARLACYLAALAVGLFALGKVLGLFAPSWGAHLGGWVEFLAFFAAVLFFILAFRWVRRRILWRLRNRLIVTYVFIGVIPAVLLVAMALITLYGLGGQFAVFVVTSEIHANCAAWRQSMPPSAMNLRHDWSAAKNRRPNLWLDFRSEIPPGAVVTCAHGTAISHCRSAERLQRTSLTLPDLQRTNSRTSSATTTSSTCEWDRPCRSARTA